MKKTAIAVLMIFLVFCGVSGVAQAAPPPPDKEVSHATPPPTRTPPPQKEKEKEKPRKKSHQCDQEGVRIWAKVDISDSQKNKLCAKKAAKAAEEAAEKEEEKATETSPSNEELKRQLELLAAQQQPPSPPPPETEESSGWSWGAILGAIGVVVILLWRRLRVLSGRNEVLLAERQGNS